MTHSKPHDHPLRLSDQESTVQDPTSGRNPFVPASPIVYDKSRVLPFDHLPTAEQQLLHEVALERIYQLSVGAETFEDAQESGQLVMAAVAYALEAQSAIVGSAPITGFSDIHPYPETAQIYGPRENLIKAIGLLLAQLKHSDAAALREQQRPPSGPMRRD